MHRFAQISTRALAAAVALALLLPVTGCNRVPVPEVRGISVSEATQDVVIAGLKVGRVTYDEASTAPQGQVIDQKPLPGRSLPKDGAVELTVAGPPPIIMPSLLGVSASAAGSMVAKLGLTMGPPRKEFSSEYPSGTVSFQIPFADQEVPGGERVTLTISEGPPPPAAPDVIGMSSSQARDTLREAGYEVLSYPVNSDAASGIVVEQVPGPGVETVKGSIVKIGVSSGVTTVVIPNLQGVAGDTAIRTLRSLGLVPRALYSEVDPGYGFPKGTVYSMTPGPDVSALKGSEIWIYIWRPPAPAPAPKPAPKPAPAPTPTPPESTPTTP